MSSGPLVALVLSKANAIEDLQHLMGPIDTFDARLKAPRR
jgi:nucleoside diphosphate kinase